MPDRSTKVSCRTYQLHVVVDDMIAVCVFEGMGNLEYGSGGFSLGKAPTTIQEIKQITVRGVWKDENQESRILNDFKNFYDVWMTKELSNSCFESGPIELVWATLRFVDDFESNSIVGAGGNAAEEGCFPNRRVST